MNLIKISTGEYPVSYKMFRLRFPGILFPKEPTNTTFEQFGYALVQPADKPTCTIYQKVVEVSPALVDGVWTQQWQVADLEGEELTAAQDYVAKEQAIVKNLPSWSTVENAVDNISSLAEAKAFLKKLARVVYWDIKNSPD